MQDNDGREPLRWERRRPSELERLIPMVGLFVSGLEDWRSASKDQRTTKRCPACGCELSGSERR